MLHHSLSSDTAQQFVEPRRLAWRGLASLFPLHGFGLPSSLSVARDNRVIGLCARARPSHPQVSAAILKLHSRRVTALEFHPCKDNIVVSADKKGGIAAWDFAKV